MKKIFAIAALVTATAVTTSATSTGFYQIGEEGFYILRMSEADSQGVHMGVAAIAPDEVLAGFTVIIPENLLEDATIKSMRRLNIAIPSGTI